MPPCALLIRSAMMLLAKLSVMSPPTPAVAVEIDAPLGLNTFLMTPKIEPKIEPKPPPLLLDAPAPEP